MKTLWQTLLQHQSTYPSSQGSASIKIHPFWTYLIKIFKTVSNEENLVYSTHFYYSQFAVWNGKNSLEQLLVWQVGDLWKTWMILNESKLFQRSSRISLVPIRTFREPLFSKPVTGQELIFAVSYNKLALFKFWFEEEDFLCRLWSS